jgi:hypothetical protein
MAKKFLELFANLFPEPWNYKVERAIDDGNRTGFVVSVNHPGVGQIYIGNPRCLEQSKQNARRFRSKRDAVVQARSTISYWQQTRRDFSIEY